MLTGTDCAGKRNKPRAAGIRLHHRGRGPGSRMSEAPAEDSFSCRGTKYIRLQTDTARGPSTKLRFRPGGTGGPGTAAQPFIRQGWSNTTQLQARGSHPSRGVVNPHTTSRVKARKPSPCPPSYPSVCLPLHAACPHAPFPKLLDPTPPSLCPYTHCCVLAPSRRTSIAHQDFTATSWDCPGASSKTCPSCRVLRTPVLFCQPWRSARNHCLIPRARDSPKCPWQTGTSISSPGHHLLHSHFSFASYQGP